MLASRSPVFEAMFEHDTIELSEGVIEIPDVRSEVCEEFLRYLYTGKCRSACRFADELLVLADKVFNS